MSSKSYVGILTLSIIKIRQTQSSDIASTDILFTFLFTNQCLYATVSFKKKKKEAGQEIKY